jgi:hypothetical protein
METDAINGKRSDSHSYCSERGCSVVGGLHSDFDFSEFRKNYEVACFDSLYHSFSDFV